jgi:hypothetical protein
MNVTTIYIQLLGHMAHGMDNQLIVPRFMLKGS